MLQNAYNSGVQAALARFKLAGTLGADYGVGPKGTEMSHGTDRFMYPPQAGANPAPGEPFDPRQRLRAEDQSDFLWNISEYDRLAPGGAGGQYGQEVIG